MEYKLHARLPYSKEVRSTYVIVDRVYFHSHTGWRVGGRNPPCKPGLSERRFDVKLHGSPRSGRFAIGSDSSKTWFYLEDRGKTPKE